MVRPPPSACGVPLMAQRELELFQCFDVAPRASNGGPYRLAGAREYLGNLVDFPPG